MKLKTLSHKEAKILQAIGAGIIPSGGPYFEIGAWDLKDKWIPRTDFMISRMPVLSRLGIKLLIRTANLAWPLFLEFRFKTLAQMKEQNRTKLLHRIEHMRFPGPLAILLFKVLIFPAFYGLEEVKREIGYREKFSNHGSFEGIKD